MEKEITEVLEKLELDSDIFNEDVMKKIALLVETKVGEKVAKAVKDKEEELDDENKKEMKEFQENLVNQLDEYLNHVTTEIIKENEEQLVDSVKVNTANRVLGYFNKMVNDFNMELSEDGLTNADENDDLKESLNYVVNENIEMKKELEENSKYALILEKTMGMEVDSERARFAKLAESFEYEDDNSFSDKLDFLKENLTLVSDKEETDTDETILDSEVTDNQEVNLEESALDSAPHSAQYMKYLQ